MMFISHIKRVFRECSTSSDGEYDPARVVGYGFTTIGSFLFLVLTVYDTMLKQSFDSVAFAAGLAGVSGTLAAAAAGVRIKDGPAIKQPEPAVPPEA